MNKIEMIKEMLKWIRDFNVENRNVKIVNITDNFIDQWVDLKVQQKIEDMKNEP